MTANTAALNNLPTLQSKFKNLAFEERQALHDLTNNRNIVIKPADKGSGVVILNTQDYIFEAFRQLADTTFYQSLDNDITQNISCDVSKTLLNMRANKEIGKNCLSYLLPQNPGPGRFYLLPKIHKKHFTASGPSDNLLHWQSYWKDLRIPRFFPPASAHFNPLLCQRHWTLFIFTAKYRTSPSRDLVGDLWCYFNIH